MSTFRLEMFDDKGKTEFVKHINISGTCSVDDAAKAEVVKQFKKEASLKGLAFRIKREEE